MFLSEQAATDLVHWALPRSKATLCQEGKTVHACGVGVGGYACRSFGESLERLRGRAGSLAFEIKLENEYTKAKLLSFAGKARAFHEALRGSVAILAETSALAALSGTFAEDAIRDAADAFLRNLVEPMERLMMELPPKMGWSDEKPPKPRRRVRDALRDLRMELLEMKEPKGTDRPLAVASGWADRTGRKLARDWRRDRVSLASCRRGARGRPRRKP